MIYLLCIAGRYRAVSASRFVLADTDGPQDECVAVEGEDVHGNRYLINDTTLVGVAFGGRTFLRKEDLADLGGRAYWTDMDKARTRSTSASHGVLQVCS